MRPDVKYDRLVDFVAQLAQEAAAYPYNNTSYGNTSQQLREAADHVARLENAMLRFQQFIGEAQQMVRHNGGHSYGSIKRAPKTNTLTGK